MVRSRIPSEGRVRRDTKCTDPAEGIGEHHTAGVRLATYELVLREEENEQVRREKALKRAEKDAQRRIDR